MCAQLSLSDEEKSLLAGGQGKAHRRERFRQAELRAVVEGRVQAEKGRCGPGEVVLGPWTSGGPAGVSGSGQTPSPCTQRSGSLLRLQTAPADLVGHLLFMQATSSSRRCQLQPRLLRGLG